MQSQTSLGERLRLMSLDNVTISKNNNPANPRSSYPGPHQEHRSIPMLGHQPQPQPQPNLPRQPQSPQSSLRGGSDQRHSNWRHQDPSNAPASQLSPQQRRPRNGSQNSPATPQISRNYQQRSVRRASAINQPRTHERSNSGVKVEIPRILQRPQNVQGSSGNASSVLQSPQRQTFRQGPPQQTYENYAAQCQYLNRIAELEIPKVEMSSAELFEKEEFRAKLEILCQEALREGYTGEISSIALKCYGSISSGFATQGSDVDLAIVPSRTSSSSTLNHPSRIDRNIPRLLEKKLLDNGFGARLLTRTRVPILKVCEKPTPKLYAALREERKKWDDLPEEEKYPVAPQPRESTPPPAPVVAIDGQAGSPQIMQHHSPNSKTHMGLRSSKDSTTSEKDTPQSPTKANEPTTPTPISTISQDNNGKDLKTPHQNRPEKPWFREKALGPLDFPKSGIGIQSDINFSNDLALHNTQLLRCYSICDPRVRPMVLFVKTWAKRRKINSSYSGTLSSYGYVLMILHYLVNIAQPPVCPNLQLCYRPPPGATPEQIAAETTIDGYEVRFWSNEEKIADAAHRRRLTVNNQPLGVLLRGFFQYYANPKFNGQGFVWANEVLSLRTPGGIRDKREKGWTAAKTTTVDGKEVRHRYLFAIEDPFEWDHNVARTVTHNGIVTIRDEFRRAWRLLLDIGNGRQPEGELCEQVVEPPSPSPPKATEAGDSRLSVKSTTSVVDAREPDLEKVLAL